MTSVATKPPVTQPPSLTVTLKPHASDGIAEYIDVELVIERPEMEKGSSLLCLPLWIVSIPTARYDADALQAKDAAGHLPLIIQDDDPTPSVITRRWLLGRATDGDVTVTFRAFPRHVTETTRGGPYYDLRAEAGGLLGAGVTFLALPDTDLIYNNQLRWDLSDMPEGTRTLWSFGEGDVIKEGPARLLAFSLYAVGPLKRYPEAADSDFSLHWLSEPPFDVAAVGEQLDKLYAYMTSFFRDDEQGYRIMTRRNPHPGTGGTAFPRSFMFGYNVRENPTADSLRTLLAHEMVHNWPRLEGADGEWYSEGTAIFYSLVLAHRAGVQSVDEMLHEINLEAAGYYTNPLRSMSLAAGAEIYWSNTFAQRLPYGRGFLYMANVDAQVRQHSGGQRSLDDLVLTMLDHKRRGEPYGLERWLELVQSELGSSAEGDFQAMLDGDLMVPHEDSFSPLFRPMAVEERVIDLGFDMSSLRREDRIIQGVDEQSNAYAAGLRKGDQLREVPNLNKLHYTADTELELLVRRGTEDMVISYVPRGGPVPAYRWVRQDTQ